MFRRSSIVIVFTMALGWDNFALAQSNHWVQTYLDCYCYTGNGPQCIGDLKERSQIPAELNFSVAFSSAAQSSEKILAQMQSAQLILEKQQRPNTNTCLAPRLADLKATIFYASNERNRFRSQPQLAGQSYVIISSLSRLAKSIYSSAYDECLKPLSSTSVSRYEPLLPDPAQCMIRIGNTE